MHIKPVFSLLIVATVLFLGSLAGDVQQLHFSLAVKNIAPLSPLPRVERPLPGGLQAAPVRPPAGIKKERTEGYAPVTMQGMQAALPSEGIGRMELPRAAYDGAATLRFPLQLPPGRQGMEPDLTLIYSSEGTNGWLGLGWSLPLAAFSVDTRWGSPRYDAARESETYLYDGRQLSPVAHRGEWVERQAKKRFFPRIEGSFERIVRHGDHPGNYWWEVTATDGTRRFYGKRPGEDTITGLRDAAGNLAYWPLLEERDLDGNSIRYRYELVVDAGRLDSPTPGYQLYLSELTYTGFEDAEGAYSVRFVRDRALGEARRPDVEIDARWGFKQVMADLLRRIEIRYREEPVRSYELEYSTGAFFKSLLSAIAELDAEGQEFYRYRLDYHDDVRKNGAYRPFAAEDNWRVPDDELIGAIINPIPGFDGETSVLGGSTSTNESIGSAITVGPNDFIWFTKDKTAGPTFSFSNARDQGLVALVDINGDGRPDKVYRRDERLWYRPNEAQPGSEGAGSFGEERPVLGIDQFSQAHTSSFSIGAEGNPPFGFVGYENTQATTTTDTYFSDFNGDDLIDIARRGVVYFNRLNENGDPEFLPSSAGTPSPVLPGDAIGDELLPIDSSDYEARIDRAPLHDVVRMWEAPYDGAVAIFAPVALQEDDSPNARSYQQQDGVRVAIQLRGNELWSDRIPGGDYAQRRPAGVDRLTVRKGDRIYFRVQSVKDGAYDQVVWDPEITYLDAEAGELDPNGRTTFRFRAAEGFLLASDATVSMPLDGVVRIDGHFQKPVTSDDLYLDIYRIAEEDTSAVFSYFFPWSDSIDQPVELDLTVRADQELQFRVRAATQVDWAAIKWMPRIYYSAADSADVTGLDGEPLLNFCPAVGFSMYNDPLRRTAPWVAPASDTLRIRPALTIDGNAGGTIVFSVKGIRRLYGRDSLRVANGALAAAEVISAGVEGGDTLFIEYHTSNRDLAGAIETAGAEWRIGDGNWAPIEAGLATAVDSTRLIFGPLYRGWGQFAYNGNRERAARPIAEGELKLDESLMNEPDSIPENPEDIDIDYDPTKTSFIVMVADPKSAAWLGYDALTFLRAKVISSSRLGEDDLSIRPPISRGGGLSAPNRISTSSMNSIAGGLGVSFASGTASKTWNETELTLDVMDFNGDGYPDVITSRGIQFTTSLGGLASGVFQHGLGHHAASSEALGFTLGGDFVASRTNNTSEPKGSSSNKRSKKGKGKSKGSRGAKSKTGKNGKAAKSASKTAASSIGISANFSTDMDQTLHSWADMNGDGLVDKVYQGGDVALNLGYRFAPRENWGFTEVQTGASTDYGGGAGVNIRNGSIAAGLSLSRTEFHSTQSLEDLNGDGLPDWITGIDPLRVRLNTGSGFADELTWQGADRLDGGAATGESLNVAFTACVPAFVVKVCFNPSSSIGRGVSRPRNEISDIDGDGYPDMLSSDHDGHLRVARSAIGRSNLLQQVRLPLGGAVVLDYAPTGNTYSMPYSSWVLSSLEIEDGRPGDGADRRKSTFTYEGGRYHRHEREFLGFALVTETHHDTNAEDTPYRRIAYRYDTLNYYRQGLLLSETLRDSAGNLYTETRFDYQLRPVALGETPPPGLEQEGGVAFPALTQVRKRYYEGLEEPALEQTLTYEYDQYGNITTFTDFGDGSAADVLLTSTTYHHLDADYLHAAPATIVQEAGGAVIRRQEMDIDPTGAVTRLRHYLDGGDYAATDLEYDVYGNVTRITRPPNLDGERLHFAFSYDEEVHSYRTAKEDGYGYRSTAIYDHRFGQLLEETDIREQTHRYTLDARGRPLTYTGPYEEASGAPYTIAFDYFPEAETPYAVARHYDPEHEGDIALYTFMDGLFRPVQIKRTGILFNGEGAAGREVLIVSGAQHYDAFGRVVHRYYPLAEAPGDAALFNDRLDGVEPSVTEYDVLDRPLRISTPGGSIKELSYAIAETGEGQIALLSSIADPLGNRIDNLTDVRGRLRETVNYGPDGLVPTRYTYNALSELIRTTDAGGNATRYHYDQLGRLRSEQHPDGGLTEYELDLAGNLISKVTPALRAGIPNGGAIRYTYEKERLVQIDYPNNVFNQVRFHYGAPGAPHRRAGRIWLQEDGSGGEEFFYGPLGEVEKCIRTFIINAANVQTFVSEYAYDAWGRLQELHYPDGEVLSYHYDRAGQLERMSGEKQGFDYEYLRQMSYDKFGQPVFMKYGNGAGTTYAYQSDRRRLERLQVQVPAGQLMDQWYTYDQAGNITSIENRAAAPAGQPGGTILHRYAYDELYRLIEASGEWEGAQSRRRYEWFMEYDQLNNPVLQSRARFEDGREEPVATALLDYRYDSGRPHVPSTIGERQYRYDAGGNQLGWQRPEAFRLAVWDEEQRLAAFSDNGYVTQFTYDARGQRAIKSHGGAQGLFADAAPAGAIDHYRRDFTLYVSPFLEAGKDSFTKHYFAGRKRLLSKGGAGSFKRSLFPPGQGVSAGNLDYSQRIMMMQAALKAHYEQLQLPPGPPTLPGFYGHPSQTGMALPAFTSQGPLTQPPPGWPQPQGPPDPEGAPGPPIWYAQPEDNTAVRAGYGFSSDFTVPELEQYYYLSDHLGSTNYLADSEGRVVHHSEYLPFGAPFVQQGMDTATGFRFTGVERDGSTGLDYFGARYYDPETAHWLSVDPLAADYAGDNPYAYTFNNPVVYIDPDGREGVEAPLVGGRVRSLINFFQNQSVTAAPRSFSAPTRRIDNGRFYDAQGKPVYPPNEGFSGTPEVRSIRPGAVLSRFGYPGGSYFSPSSVPYGARALPAGTDENKPLFTYVVLKPFRVKTGQAAPWFGEVGGGTQFKLDDGANVKQLIEGGYLRVLREEAPGSRKKRRRRAGG